MSDHFGETLRQRGWSMQSEGTAGTMTEEEKLQLLQAMPPAPAAFHEETAEETESDINQEITQKRVIEEETDEERAEHPEKKKPRLLEMAKSRLSKWAARLFDPHRPKGLIQSPEIIPLNDTFLSAFGRREKEHDSRHGVVFPIETAIEDTDDEQDGSAVSEKESTSATAKPASATSFKVKITNLKFTTTEKKLEQACSKYGVVQSIQILMDADNDKLNKGRAFCTFTTEEAAKKCIENLVELDGRKLRVSTAGKAASNTNNTSSSSDSTRYYVRDLSTKCYRCGAVGHYADSCTNEPLAKPCPLCSMTSHDFRECPTKQVCFNCQLPGHVSRNCTMPRGVPQRRICTICFWSGHVKEECRTYNRNVSQNAQCMICGQMGHFMCQEMKWYFGLRGVSCSNCGRTGHTGPQCDRPRLEDCSRNEDLGQKEVERAATWNTAEDEISRGQQARGRPQHREFDNNNDPRRNRSMPPMNRGQRQDSGGNNRSSNQPRSGGRGRGQNENKNDDRKGQNNDGRPPPKLDQPLSSPSKSRRR